MLVGKRNIWKSFLGSIGKQHPRWEMKKDDDFDILILTNCNILAIKRSIGEVYPQEVANASYIGELIADEMGIAICPVFITNDRICDNVKGFASKKNVRIWKLNQETIKWCINRAEKVAEYSHENCILPRELR
jgi:hypothetical protein